MTHKFDAKHKHKLDNPKRREILPPTETLLKLELTKGDIVADIGCGIGYFSIPAAQIVGDQGKVFAMDISQEMLDEAKKSAEEHGLRNIEFIKSAEANLPLSDNSVGYCFISNVLHEADDRTALVKEMKRILKDEGKLVIIEWNDKIAEWGPPADHRLSSDYIVELLQKDNLHTEDPISISEYFYGIISRK